MHYMITRSLILLWAIATTNLGTITISVGYRLRPILRLVHTSFKHSPQAKLGRMSRLPTWIALHTSTLSILTLSILIKPNQFGKYLSRFPKQLVEVRFCPMTTAVFVYMPAKSSPNKYLPQLTPSNAVLDDVITCRRNTIASPLKVKAWWISPQRSRGY